MFASPLLVSPVFLSVLAPIATSVFKCFSLFTMTSDRPLRFSDRIAFILINSELFVVSLVVGAVVAVVAGLAVS